MKSKIKIMIIVIIVTLVLSACKNYKQTYETNFDNISKSEFSAVKEQSDIPYLGDNEITPLFAGRNSIGDWIKDIKISDAEYVLYTDSEAGEVRLDISSSSEPGYSIASFNVEKNNYVGFSNDKVDGICISLSDEVKKLKVTDVNYVDFEKMGIYYNIRNIIKGSSADEVKKAFLDMNREIDTSGVPYRELYNIRDIEPNIKIEPYYENYSLIRGIDTIVTEQGGFREIIYYHAKFYEQENSNYSVWYSQSSICFLIDTNDNVAGLSFSKTRRTNE